MSKAFGKDPDLNFICQENGCYFKNLSCSEVKEIINDDTEHHIKLRIGDEYIKNVDNQFQINYALEDDFFDQDGSCYVPIFSLLPLSGESDEYFELVKERHTWFLGSTIMEKYFTIFDNRPTEGGNFFNYVGIAPCATHAAHLDTYLD